jgi:hypothetical protein
MSIVLRGHDMLDTVARTSTATWAVSTGAAYLSPVSMIQEVAVYVGLFAGLLACVSWCLKIRKQWRDR